VAANFRQAMGNSLVVATFTTVISLVVGTLGGYAFARLRFRLRRTSLFAFLMIYMLPPIALVIPLYLALAALGLLDTKTGLVVTYCSIVTPFCLWTMSNYFLSMPPDLEEAARVDGCTRVGALVRVILPLARPGVLTTAMFGFLLAWDEFLYSLIFTSTSNAKTIPVAIAEFTGKFSSDFGLIAAGGVVASLPPLLLALVFQRYIVGGLTSGAVKG
jgi:multiple sugar transport system permease protein